MVSIVLSKSKSPDIKVIIYYYAYIRFSLMVIKNSSEILKFQDTVKKKNNIIVTLEVSSFQKLPYGS